MSTKPGKLMSERLMSGKLALSVAALLLAAFGAFAGEATYPDRPITMIVTFPAGGASDVLARASADALSRGLGQPVVVDNRPGAGGHIGAEFVAHAAPDGYTILFGTNGTLGIGPALYKNLRYDPQRDLAPIGILHKLPLLLIVNPSIPAKTLPELIDYARHQSGKAELRIGRCRHRVASRGRAFQEGGGDRHPARPVQGRWRHVPGFAGRPRLDDAGDNTNGAAVGAKRADARDRRDDGGAIAIGAGYTNTRTNPACRSSM